MKCRRTLKHHIAYEHHYDCGTERYAKTKNKTQIMNRCIMVRYLQNTLEYTNYTFHVQFQDSRESGRTTIKPDLYGVHNHWFILSSSSSSLLFHQSPWSSSLYTFTFGHQPSVDMVTKPQSLFISVPSNDTRSNKCHVQIFNKN